jgi:LmbE family N-acetylglucosaminyl deacetylase
MKVMVFAAHPDDDLIGCGGSIVKHVKSGVRVIVVYMTSGDSGSIVVPKERIAEIREEEVKDSAKILGTEATFLKQPDGYLEYNKKNLIEVTNLIRKLKPDWVYIHHKNDGHPDHQTTFKIVKEAVRRAADSCFQDCHKTPHKVSRVLCYEVWTPLSEFNFSVDISEFMPQKLKALRMHKSQLKLVKYDEAVEGLNRYRGAMTGKGKYAEVFDVILL